MQQERCRDISIGCLSERGAVQSICISGTAEGCMYEGDHYSKSKEENSIQRMWVFRVS